MLTLQLDELIAMVETGLREQRLARLQGKGKGQAGETINWVREDVGDRYLYKHCSPWYTQEKRPSSPFLCTYRGRQDTRRGRPFRFILNHSTETASNVYLMLYPKPVFAKALFLLFTKLIHTYLYKAQK